METTLRLDICLPKLTVGEVSCLIEWSRSKVEKFPHFAEWVCLLATDEMGRRLNPGDEAGMTPLPTLTGTKASDFLMGSFVLCRLPLSEGLATFADDLALKITCDICGYLETQDQATDE